MFFREISETCNLQRLQQEVDKVSRECAISLVQNSRSGFQKAGLLSQECRQNYDVAQKILQVVLNIPGEKFQEIDGKSQYLAGLVLIIPGTFHRSQAATLTNHESWRFHLSSIAYQIAIQSGSQVFNQCFRDFQKAESFLVSLLIFVNKFVCKFERQTF